MGALGDSYTGFDHGVGHPLLFLCDAKVPNYRKNKGFKVLGPYAEWPKVADAVIKALTPIENLSIIGKKQFITLLERALHGLCCRGYLVRRGAYKTTVGDVTPTPP